MENEGKEFELNFSMLNGEYCIPNESCIFDMNTTSEKRASFICQNPLQGGYYLRGNCGFLQRLAVSIFRSLISVLVPSE